MNLVRLGIMLDRKDYREHAAGIFKAFRSTVESSPSQFERLLSAADMYHDRVKEIVIAGNGTNAQTVTLIETVYSGFLPNKVLLFADTSGKTQSDQTVNRLPLLKGKKQIDGKSAAYVCENKVCQRPVTDVESLRKQLGFR